MRREILIRYGIDINDERKDLRHCLNYCSNNSKSYYKTIIKKTKNAKINSHWEGYYMQLAKKYWNL